MRLAKSLTVATTTRAFGLGLTPHHAVDSGRDFGVATAIVEVALTGGHGARSANQTPFAAWINVYPSRSASACMAAHEQPLGTG